MAVSAALLLLVLAHIPCGMATDTPAPDQPLAAAVQEMQRANYFAFVMLLNMVPSEKIPDNVTFLMPNNRVLAKAAIPENDVLDFLLRHSIPTSLRFEHLKHFPTGSIIPSSEPGFAIKISNNGRRSFFLNNAKLVSPDICVAGSLVRCHGIDGVLIDGYANTTAGNSTPVTYDSPPTIVAAPPAMAPPGRLSPDGVGGGGIESAPAATPQPEGLMPVPRKSGSSGMSKRGRSVGIWWVMLLILRELV